jgi:hypothetical protein
MLGYLRMSCEYNAEEKIYKFFTYDPTGKDCIIPIRARSRDEAFDKFDRTYGFDTPVDFVVAAEDEYKPAGENNC